MRVIEPRYGLTPADCWFYHTVDLPVSGRQEGAWDLTGRFDDYTAHEDLAGKTVLDVGTASGFLSFEAEKRGATVTSFDIDHAGRWFELPIRGTEFVDDYPAWLARSEIALERLRNSYWLCHQEFESEARYMVGDVYDLDGRQYDVVVLGQILVHLRDGLSALTAAARVCADTLIVVEGNLPRKDPVAGLCGRADHPEMPHAWYHYSHGWYREVLAMLGFRSVEIVVGSFVCNDALHPAEIKLATVIASRETVAGRRGGILTRLRGADTS
jgi:SAM-dependent methyltransferase